MSPAIPGKRGAAPRRSRASAATGRTAKTEASNVLPLPVVGSGEVTDASRVAATPQPPAPVASQSGPAVLAPPVAARPPDRDEAMRDMIDRTIHALIARGTLGLSPAALGLALADWAMHMAASPGKQASLAAHAARLHADWLRYAAAWSASTFNKDSPACPECLVPPASDRRFAAPQWQQFPFNLIQQSFLLRQNVVAAATHGLHGVSPHHEQVVAFMSRQWMDMLSPSNFFWTNPEVLDRTLATGGLNLVQGIQNWQEDLQRLGSGHLPPGAEHFRPGHEVAATAGKVVLRNRLMELIQYAPTTPTVHAEPVLIIPAWIMKYYILDLSAHNSLVRYLVDQGHTVFMVSWKNPGADDRDVGMDDYLRLGPLAALDAVNSIVPDRKVHATGYCLGGTLLAITAGALAGRGAERLASVSLFAAQTDFTEAGELTLFTDESQVSFLEDLMWSQGYLDTTQMAGTFQMLRSSDLIWSRIMHDYLMGERAPLTDLMAWNADATRMPYRMHSEYLRRLYLRNALAEGHYKVDGRPVAVENVRAPWFVVGTENDHVAPWKSVYKIHLLADSEVTFVLTSGGHNAGIVSEPGHPHRHFRWAVHPGGRPYADPDHWVGQARQEDGSWWPRWDAWLVQKGSGQRVTPPPMGNAAHPAIGDAPGEYVLQR